MGIRLNPFTGELDLVGTTGAGAGTVTSVAGGVGITNTPDPIVGAGTVDLDINSLTTEAVFASGDFVPFVDISAAGTPIAQQRKGTVGNLASALNPLLDHGTLLGLADDDHTQYALLAGRAGGQALQGGTTPIDDLTLTGPDTIRLDSETRLWPSQPAPTASIAALTWAPTFSTGAGTISVDGALFDPTINLLNGSIDYSNISLHGTYTSNIAPGFTAIKNLHISGEYLAGASALHAISDTYGVFDDSVFKLTNAVNITPGAPTVYGYSHTPTFTITAGAPAAMTFGLSETVRSGMTVTVAPGATFTLAGRIGLDIYDIDISGVAGTFVIGQQQGVSVQDLTAPLVDGFYSEISAGAGKYFLRGFGTAVSALTGGLRIGDTTQPTQKLEVLGHVLLDNSGTASELRLREPSASGSNYTAFKAQAQAGDITYALPATNAVGYLRNTGPGTLSWDATGAGIDHGGLGGLADDDHTQYFLLAGRGSSQTASGGTASGDDLTLRANSSDFLGTVFIDSEQEWWDSIPDFTVGSTVTRTVALFDATFVMSPNAAVTHTWNGLRMAPNITSTVSGGGTSAINFINIGPTLTIGQDVALSVLGTIGTITNSAAPTLGTAFLFFNGFTMESATSGVAPYPLNTYVDGGTLSYNVGAGSATTANTRSFRDQRTVQNVQASGTYTVTNLDSFDSAVNVVETAGTMNVTTRRGVRIRDIAISGTPQITNNIGVDVEALTQGSSINCGLRNAATTIFTPSSAQTISAAGNTILANATVVLVSNTTAGSLTLTSAPTIADGQNGQYLIIISTGTQNVVIQDQGTLGGSNLRLSAATQTLAPRDNIVLVYSSAIGDWVQVGFTNVI